MKGNMYSIITVKRLDAHPEHVEVPHRIEYFDHDYKHLEDSKNFLHN